jgi:hypothetical protein
MRAPIDFMPRPSARVRRLHEQMDVIALDRVRDHAEPRALLRLA